MARHQEFMPTITSSKDTNTQPMIDSAQELRQKNAVALEVAVTVSGTRPTDGESRGLFNEEASTVLVFESGAVIRLAADVAVGQLVFVTDKNTKREVVCQVLNKRASQGANNYVEVEFTEHMENFWGDIFPAQPKKEAPTKGSIGGVVGKLAPSREQRGVPVRAPEKVKKQAAKIEIAAQVMELADVGDATPVNATPTEASAAEDVQSKREALMARQVKLPANLMVENWKKAVEETATKPEEESFDDLLPVPDLQFSQMGSEAASEVAAVADEKPAAKGAGKIRVAILAGVLVAAGVGAAIAWYENWLPFLPRTSAAVSTGAVGGGAGAHAASVVGKKTDAVKGGGAAELKSAAPSVAAAKVADVKDSASVPESNGASAAEKIEKEPVIRPIERRHADAQAGAAAAVGETAAEENVGGEEIAPKLLKVANPEYPADAMRQYVTGDVRVEATVDANGKVREAKAMTGPAVLQAAAVDAVKQYEYAPGTRGGKAVEAKVSVMVKFWFNP
jgi:TonB family protein